MQFLYIRFQMIKELKKMIQFLIFFSIYIITYYLETLTQYRHIWYVPDQGIPFGFVRIEIDSLF